MKKIVFCGGGTAGHIIPNLALVPYLQEHFDQIHYIGSEGGIEKNILAAYPNIFYYEISCPKLVRKFTLKNLLIPFRLIASIISAKRLLNQIKPDIIFSKGGFASLPIIFAKGKIPAIAHESDITMGLANKLIKSKCEKFCTTFQSTALNMPNGIHCGAPLRQEIYSGNKQRVLKETGFLGVKPILLVMGGSLGARAINELVKKALPDLTKSFDIIHLTGKGGKTTQDNTSYKAYEYRSDICDILAAADFVVSRGGSNALCELIALKKPSLIIPLPKTESRGDQLENAAYFRHLRLINTASQEKLNEKSFVEAIKLLQKNKNDLKFHLDNAKNIDGTKKIADLILSSARLRR